MKGLYDNEMKLEFTSKTSNEAFARITVAAFAAQLDPTIDELSDIKTAVSEAVTNSIIHGYDDEDGIVKIEAKIFAKVESAIGFGTKVIMKKKIESKEYDENDTYKLENKIEASNKKIINEWIL